MGSRCPECGSTQIEQYRMPYGPIWCVDCGFRVEDKTAQPSPFLEPEESAAGLPEAAARSGESHEPAADEAV